MNNLPVARAALPYGYTEGETEELWTIDPDWLIAHPEALGTAARASSDRERKARYAVRELLADRLHPS